MTEERRGIERLRWLEGKWEFPDGIAREVTRMAIIGESATNVEVAFALIEELHDALTLISQLEVYRAIKDAEKTP
jgi:hypothetical protein